jgi:hypothetical protein
MSGPPLTATQAACLRAMLAATARQLVRRNSARWATRYHGGEAFGTGTIDALSAHGLVEKRDRIAGLTVEGLARAQAEKLAYDQAIASAQGKSRARAPATSPQAYFQRTRQIQRERYQQQKLARLPYADT